MKITGITSIFAAAATAGVVGAPIVSAEATTQTQTLGDQGKLVDGSVVQGWTVDNLQPSTDAIPYEVQGTLWEATANDQAIEGSVTPIVSNFNARADSGDTYRALFGVATPQGVNPATLAQGQQVTGKVYFDVTGAEPDSVVYNAGGQDLLVWVEAPESTSDGAQSTSYPSYSSESPVTVATPAEPEAVPAEPEAVPGEPAAEGTPAAPAAAGTEEPLPAGSQGTPLPAGSQGTPLPPAEGTAVAPPAEGAPVAPPVEGAPVAPPAEGAPIPASTEGSPQPAGSEGTPLPAGDEMPTPTTYTPAPTPTP